MSVTANPLPRKLHSRQSAPAIPSLRTSLSLRTRDAVVEVDELIEAPVLLRRGVQSLADITPEPVEWLWEPYIPIGKLTMIEGDPGLGKSWLSLGIATSVSLGRGLPNAPGFAPRNVLLLNDEDGAADTIRPRLDAMGADVHRLFVVEDVATFDDGGLERLEAHIEHYHANLVIVDPWVAYFVGDLNKANETRKVLKLLAKLAERQHCAIVLIRHLTKGSRDKSIYRGQGNVDITGACRSVMLAGSDPDEPTRKALIHIKSNLARSGPSISFSIEDGRFTWGGISTLTAERLLAPQRPRASKVETAMDFVREQLAEGPMAAGDLETRAGRIGISAKTLKRARQDLGVQATAVRKGSRINAWQLALTTH